ncbi:hypothetical protein G4B88_001154 [Cannabis sativa]|uniref:Uncharacterized protein n=1 Tax=Cannabis sativa TaxID=3483 RepID=A0A7J6GIB7_CANSA|nr:hypothetical protein G4B88_001154 [Cannabis sativa]
MENPMKFYKPNNKEYYYYNYYNYNKLGNKGMVSFFASILSVFIYTSIFYYTFNLSISTLFHNSKFWFLISNTLIIIIAVDYGAFSSSSSLNDNTQHPHDENNKKVEELVIITNEVSQKKRKE